MSSRLFNKALGETGELTDALIGYLSLVRHILDYVTSVRTFAAAARAIAEALVVEMGFEWAAVVVVDDGGEQEIIGQYSQAERFGEGCRLAEAERRAINALAVKVRSEAGVLHWSTRDNSFGLGTLPIDGSLLGIPLLVGGERCGAVVAQRLVARKWDLAEQQAFELVSQIISQVVTVTQLRISLTAMRDEIEGELGRTRSKVTAQEQTLKAQGASIARLTEALIVSSRVKTDFLATISHELRTPLNVILGYSTLLRDRSSGPLNQEQQDQLQRIVCNGRNLSQLVDDILFFVQTESTKLESRSENIEVEALIADICDTLPEASSPEGPTLEIFIDSEAGSITSDRHLLNRIVFHLLNNAYKFTERGKIRVEVTPGDEPDTVKFRIVDTGRGIPSDKLDSLFSLLEDPSRAKRRQLGGVGLGLTLVRRCLGVLGGNLSVESKVGEGTEVFFTIPGALSTRASRTGT